MHSASYSFTRFVHHILIAISLYTSLSAMQNDEHRYQMIVPFLREDDYHVHYNRTHDQSIIGFTVGGQQYRWNLQFHAEPTAMQKIQRDLLEQELAMHKEEETFTKENSNLAHYLQKNN